MFYTINLQSQLKVTQSCPTLCDPMNCSTAGLPVHHQLPESTQIHVHRVSDAIQPSSSVIPFSSCPQSFPASGSFLMSWLFASGGQSIGASASVLPMNQFSSVAQSCLTLCDPVDCSMPELPVKHKLPELLKLMSIESVMPSNHLILCRGEIVGVRRGIPALPNASPPDPW